MARILSRVSGPAVGTRASPRRLILDHSSQNSALHEHGDAGFLKHAEKRAPIRELAGKWPLERRSLLCNRGNQMTPATLQTPPNAPTRDANSQLQHAHAKLTQLEQLLKQGRTHLQSLRMQVDEARRERDELRGKLEHTEAERDDISEKHDQVAFLLTELRADRERLAETLTSTESQRVLLEEKLEDATSGLEQLRAAADRALSLAREIVDGCGPELSSRDVPAGELVGAASGIQ
jgi:hypothetical protein